MNATRFLQVLAALAILVSLFAVGTILLTNIGELGALILIVGLPASAVIAWIVTPPKSQSPSQPRRQQRRTEQNSGEVGMGGGDAPSMPTPNTVTHHKAANIRPSLQEAFHKIPVNAWTLGMLLWILVLAAYIYFGYYWQGMPLWLGVFTLSVIPACQTKFLNLLGAGKVWRGVLVYVVLVAETMLYWYYLYQLPIVPVLAGYLLVMVATILGARRLVVEESHVEPDTKREGGDDQPDAARKSEGGKEDGNKNRTGKPPGAD